MVEDGWTSPAVVGPASTWGPPALGELRPAYAGVRRILVLRGGGLGDLVFVLPAVEALAAAYPGAEITLLGAPSHAALLAGRPSPFAHVEVLPGHPGVQPGTPDPEATAALRARLRERSFDLALQLHGGGRNSNPYLLELGARHTAGTGTPDAPPLERTVPYLYYQHEVLRWLEVAAAAGAPAVMIEPQLRLTAVEQHLRAVARRRSGDAPPLVLLHPGATDPRRRWPARSYAELAVALAREDAEVAVVGDSSDAAAGAEIVRTAREAGVPEGAVRSVAGELPLDALVALLCRAAVLVGNDSGPRHLAQAAGTPTVGIFWFGNVINAAPLSRARQRIQIGWQTHCPVCGADCTQVGWTAERCSHQESLVADVTVEAVRADVRALWGG